MAMKIMIDSILFMYINIFELFLLTVWNWPYIAYNR